MSELHFPPKPDPLLGSSIRTLPMNLEAEQALLGAIMANPKALHAVADFLRPEHFADGPHGRVYRECARRILAGGVADAVTLTGWWARDEEFDALGGNGFISGLLASMVGIVNAKDYGRVIYEAWQLRELIAIGTDIVNGSYGSVPDPAELIAQASAALDGTFSRFGGDRVAPLIVDAADQALADADAAASRGGFAGLSTGMPSVDDALGGMEPGELLVLAGRPGMGKTALGTQWTVSVARHLRDTGAASGVCMFSIEMTAKALARRVLSTLSGVSIRALKRGEHSDWTAQLMRARGELHGLQLAIEDAGSMTVGSMQLRARAARRRFGGLALVVVDHLHIVEPEQPNTKDPTWAVGRVSKGLKEMAKQLECPVLALAQLNRAVESRDDKRPTKADLRQAGDIEQNADAITFVYRPEYYLSKAAPEQNSTETREKWQGRIIEWEETRQRLAGKAELICAKVRDGEECIVPLRFDGRHASFTEAN